MIKLNVQGVQVSIISHKNEEYVSLTDMIKAKEGVFFIESWLRNRNTLEFLGVWETLYNPSFNSIEFDVIKSKSGLNSFKVSVKELVERTKAIGLIAKAGRYGGTYAAKDIAYEFGTWISPEFKLYLIREFQRLKTSEAARLETGWDYRRFLSKTNYAIHTDAVKDFILPELTDFQARFIYTSEADLLNVALFGMRAKDWKEENTGLQAKGLNMRDTADVHQLIVLSNLESNNAYLISKGMSQHERLSELRNMAIAQLQSLRKSKYSLAKMQSPFGSGNDNQHSNNNDKSDISET